MKSVSALGLTSALSMSVLAFHAQVNAASIVRISQSAFTPDAGLITFSELPFATVNPTYAPALYGGNATAPTVTFGGTFLGQTVGVPPFPPGASPGGVVNGLPNNPLALDSASPATFITNDGSNPTSPVLSGTPTFNGAISILFDKDVAGVGLEGGFFNAVGGTAITAFARNGSVLGSVTNVGTGIEFLGLVTEDGLDRIAGLQFSLVGSEPFGFAIDNLRFGSEGQVTVPPKGTPEPITTLGSLVTGAVAFAFCGKQKKEKKAAAKA